MQGVVAAGHPVSAEVGAAVLRDGGNAVDATIAAGLASWVTEPLLTGPGAGGYMLVAGGGVEPTLLDFFVAAPSDGPRSELVPVNVSFGDADQLFHCGAASVGAYGNPAGLAAAAECWARLPLAELASPAVWLAENGVAINRIQAYIIEILDGIVRLTPEIAARFAHGNRLLSDGDTFRDRELAGTIRRFGQDGAEPFYTGDIAELVIEQVAASGGTLSESDLAGYEAIARRPATVRYHHHTVLTNPPPSAGGVLLAAALHSLSAATGGAPPQPDQLLDAMRIAQSLRSAQFDAELADPGFLERFVAANLGSTTHISVLDRDGMACSMTCTNGEGSGLVTPGTGIHLNNIMGEEDLSPQGFFTAPAGRRMPSMMSPTVLFDEEGAVQAVLGSAGSNRIRSTLLQAIVAICDRGADARAAVDAPRVHAEGGVVYAEPGSLPDGWQPPAGETLAPFRERNLFFGGAQVVCRDPATGRVSAAGDPRRGGAVAFA